MVAIQSDKIIHGNYELLDLLLNNGADLEARDCNGNIAVLLACSSRTSIHSVPRLVANSQNGVHKKCSDVCARNNEGLTALYLIATKSQLPGVGFIVKLLIKRGADIEAIDTEKGGNRPIQSSCLWGNVEVTQVLEMGAKIEKNSRGLTPLLIAVCRTWV
jgi:ankyrin repeat protein